MQVASCKWQRYFGEADSGLADQESACPYGTQAVLHMGSLVPRLTCWAYITGVSKEGGCQATAPPKLPKP
jgi:hypothetical protein